MADILRATFSKEFSWTKCFDLSFTYICSCESSWHKAIIGSGDKWQPNRQQTVTSTNDNSVFRHIFYTFYTNHGPMVWNMYMGKTFILGKKLYPDQVANYVFLLWYPLLKIAALQWRHNRRDGVPNHQPHDCLLNRSFRRKSKKTSKLRVTGLCAPVTGDKWPVTRNMFPSDDVIVDWALSLLVPITYSYSDDKQWQMYPDLGHSIDKHATYCKIWSRQIYERIRLNCMNPMLDIELLSYQIEPQKFI